MNALYLPDLKRMVVPLPTLGLLVQSVWLSMQADRGSDDACRNPPASPEGAKVMPGRIED